jgi:hypothetical protein
MFEFFTYKENSDYFRASDFIKQKRLPYTFQHWTNTRVQHHMEGHMVHVGRDRLTNTVEWTGKDDDLYLADFENAWRSMMENLKPQHRDRFREEIDLRLTDPEFALCGTLGKRFRFRAECKFEAPDDWYHPMYFVLPTLDVTIRVTVPPGWTTWVGRESPAASECITHTEGLYMPGDKVEIQWRRPSVAPAV